MSHIVEIKTEIRDPVAVTAACRRLKLDTPVQGTTRLFSQDVTGLQVRLRDWTYPLVIQTETGKLQYDNYNGHWGKQERLDEFLQAYAVEKTRLEALMQGYSCVEQQLSDGRVKLTIQLGGGVA
jgi:hypothetical protein